METNFTPFASWLGGVLWVVPGSISVEDIREHGAIMAATSQPVFANCRSGMRATSLLELSAAQYREPTDDILRTGKAAGLDLSALADRLAARAA